MSYSFGLYIALVALCIAYRHKTAAARNRKIYEKARRLQYAEFCVKLNPKTDEDIIEFLKYITVLEIYIRMLVEVDIGERTKQKLIEICPKRTIPFNTDFKLRNFKVEIDREFYPEVIKKLNRLKSERNVYIKRLIRDDIAYRKAHNLLLD